MAERQHGKYISDIRGDHVERYDYAARRAAGRVLDAACGCGYGTYIMCMKNTSIHAVGVDRCRDTIHFAQYNWKHERNRFYRWDLDKVTPMQPYNYLVCFETIEHLKEPEIFLKSAAGKCRNIICSVPNQDVIPFDPAHFPFHHRHYTKPQIIDLLNRCGFIATKIMYQPGVNAEGFTQDTGRTIIVEGVSSVRPE